MMKGRRAPVVATAGFLLTSACATILPLRPGFHEPSAAPAARFPVKIALVADKEIRSRDLEAWEGFDLTTIKTDPEFVNAVKAELSATFQDVRLAGDAADSKGADYVVTINGDFPATIGLSFHEPRPEGAAASFERPGTASQHNKGVAVLQILLLPVTLVALPTGLNGRLFVRGPFERRISDALHEITEEIRGDTKLLETPVRRAKAEAEERAADEADRAGNSRDALSRYAGALRQCSPGAEAERRVRDKLFRLARAMNPPPAPSDEAKVHAERAHSFLRRGKDPRAYQKAIEEYRMALDQAPWWAEGYYNLGLVQDKAEDFAGAAQSLKLYLLAAPDAADADVVKKKIVDLEVAGEMSGASDEAPPEAKPEPPAGEGPSE